MEGRQDMEKKTELTEQQKDAGKMSWKLIAAMASLCWLFMGVLVTVTLIINWRKMTPSAVNATEYLKIIAPILVTFVGAIFGFLGWGRLKGFDDQIDRLRKELREDIRVEKQALTAARMGLEKRLPDEIQSGIILHGGDWEKRVQAQGEKERHMLEEDWKQFLDKSKSMMKDFDDKYNWLKAEGKSAADLKGMLNPVTLYDAHKNIEEMFSNKASESYTAAKEFTKQIIAGELQGDSNDFHNFAAELARQNLYREACQICEAGTSDKLFPENVDLLADWIQFATKLGDYAAVEHALAKLEGLDYLLWNWRAYDFTVDYFLARGNTDEAERYAKQFVESRPNEERAYYSLASVYEQMNDTERLLNTLRRPIEDGITCPMCANKLADLLSDCGRLDEALKYADIAVADLAQEQPSVNYAFVFYRRALICDRLCRRARANNESEKAFMYAKESIGDYDIAIRSRKLTYITLSQAQTRRDLLLRFYPQLKSKDEPSQEDQLSALMQILQAREGGDE